MTMSTTHKNRLIHEKSPYLLQHANNPVDWFPWGTDAFEKAKAEDKPIFLSIGYSTCHWCHVMSHESFEDTDTAAYLNEHFIAIKVDKEERPDIDSIYMAVCQAFTGSGGWPMSIFITPDQKPFFAGTYFPKSSRYGMVSFLDLLKALQDKWTNDRAALLRSANHVTTVLSQSKDTHASADTEWLTSAFEAYKSTFDEKYGGFGSAPKFPAPHNLLFLMTHYEKSDEGEALNMAKKTLFHLYAGGLFDHIGYGFSRYSTDRYFLVPHFEKMLYDNALLIQAYCKAYQITKNPFYLDVADKTATYILREMTSPDGGFYSAQDADSEGEEGKYYVFEPSELITLLGEQAGAAFNEHYSITKTGNFEGKSIPNLLRNPPENKELEHYLPQVYAYRLQRTKLHLDDKILTSWNALMIAAMCHLYRASRKLEYLEAAQRAQQFIEKNLCEQDKLFVSYREGKRGEKGFLDDYAQYEYALLALYDATLDASYLTKAQAFHKKTIADFYDSDNGGFFLYGKDNETLILRPKETYDGAIPSGNSVMTYNLVRLSQLFEGQDDTILQRQLEYMCGASQGYPAGYAMFLIALSDYFDPPQTVTVVLSHPEDAHDLPFLLPTNSIVRVLPQPTEEYPLKNGQTTYYVCRHHNCLPPGNDLTQLLDRV